MQLILASTSPARLATLRAAGIEPLVVPSEVDEDAAVAAAEATSGPLTPEQMVLLLARVKAEAVLGLDQVTAAASAAGDEGILILGGDSAFVLDGVIYGAAIGAGFGAAESWGLGTELLNNVLHG